MKICCSQEHYDKVVQYAKSINDKTLENCLERLKQWEKNENRPCEIELYYDQRHIRSDSANAIRTEIQALSEDCCIMEIWTSPLPSSWNVSTDGAYIHRS